MDQAISAALVIAPVVVGLTELAKRSGIREKLAPVMALVNGLLVAALVAWSREVEEVTFDKPAYVILTGLVAGLSAAGIYSGTRALTGSSSTR